MKKSPENSKLVKKGDLPQGESPSPVGKHPGGRPPKYSTPEELQTVIDQYFESCWADRPMVGRVQIRPYTIAGLALAVGLTPQGLREYQVKDQFSCIIKEAKQRVEMYAEEQLFDGKGSGSIFWLKNNAGYTDKREVEHSGKLTLEEILGASDE